MSIEFLVRNYYALYDYRKKMLAEEDTEVSRWVCDKTFKIERDIVEALTLHVHKDPVGRWLMSIEGIDAVMAAGLLTYVDIKQHQTVEDLWNFAGLGAHQKDPGLKELKTVCHQIGHSFAGRRNSFYGALFQKRCKREIDLHGETLTPGHIAQRARRHTVKMFLEGFHDACFYMEYGKISEKQYNYEIEHPNFEMIYESRRI